MKWVNAVPYSTSPSGKTALWQIRAKEGNQWLGDVHWYAPWRKYAFFPLTGTVFEPDCLRDIADFCEGATRDHNYQLWEKRQKNQGVSQ